MTDRRWREQNINLKGCVAPTIVHSRGLNAVPKADFDLGGEPISTGAESLEPDDPPIARDLMNDGININTILPDIFDTPLMAGTLRRVREALAASVPFPKRFGSPPEYASLALMRMENSYFNGADIRLDGAIRMAPRPSVTPSAPHHGAALAR